MFKKRLEFKILGVVVLLLIVTTVIIGTTVIAFQRSSMERMAYEKTDSMATLVTNSIEVAMRDGRPEVARDMVESLRRLSRIESVGVFNWEGREAFDKTAPLKEAAALDKIRRTGSAMHERVGDEFVYYRPMINNPGCQGCHGADRHVLGAVKVAISVADVDGRFKAYLVFAVVGSLFGIVSLATALWIALRRLIVRPVIEIQRAAGRLANGDISFDVEITSEDEIGEMASDLKESVRGIGVIIRRIREVAVRASTITDAVAKESRNILEGTRLEADAIANISASIEELNVSISGISESVDSLSASAEETSASVAEMAASTEQVAQSANELNAAMDTTSVSIEQMSATIREVARGAEDLAVTADETTSAIEEIGAAVKEVDVHAREALAMSQLVKDDAEGVGLSSVQRTIDGMGRIREAVQTAGEYITRLGGRSEAIGRILTVIDEITDQTTLLALNAAILAAQAGEHGKGFSVVADEIKDLADRTAVSTKEIAGLIEAVQSEVQGAVDAMDEGIKRVDEGISLSNESGKALSQIVERAARSTEMAASIERSTAEQAKGVALVGDAMGRVRDMIQQVAKATAEQTKGVALIMESTEKIRDVSAHLKTATYEQSKGSRQISDAVENVSERIQHIATAIQEQKRGSDLIISSIEKIRELPASNRALAFSINKGLRDILQDTELLETEGARFDVGTGGVSGTAMTMGIVPLESPAAMFKKFSPLADYLGRCLGRTIELRVPVDFENAIRDIGTGAVSLCFMTPSTYIEARDQYGVQVVAKALRHGKPFHHAAIVVKEDSPVNTLEDLKGRSVAFGDRHSTSSHILPRSMLLEAGVDLESLAFYDYLGHHDDVARAVLDGQFDAGGLMETVALKYVAHGLRILRTSPEIPEFNICVERGADADVRNKLLQALRELKDDTPAGREILHSINEEYTGFVESQDSDYEGVRMIMAKLDAGN